MLFGKSLGTGVAIALAAERKVARIILQAPFTSAADIGAAVYPFLPVRLLMKDQFRSDERIGKVKAPLLILHGAFDRMVPLTFGERLLCARQRAQAAGALSARRPQRSRFPGRAGRGAGVSQRVAGLLGFLRWRRHPVQAAGLL